VRIFFVYFNDYLSAKWNTEINNLLYINRLLYIFNINTNHIYNRVLLMIYDKLWREII